MFGISKRKMFALAAAIGTAGWMVSGTAHAATATLTSNNSSLTFNSVGDSVNWVVDGTDEFGGTPAGSDVIDFYNGTDLEPLTDLTLQSHSVSANIASGTFTGTLGNDNFSITVQVILNGGSAGSGASGINETITVNNLGPTIVPPVPDPLPIDFIITDTFDANLNATPNNDTLTLSPAGLPTTAVQTDPTGVKLTYTTATTPHAFEFLNNGSGGTTLGPETGNEAFEFVWELALPAGDTGIISNTISLSGQGSTAAGVPLPNSAGMALATLTGLGAVAIIRRKRTIA
jgi:hypothetical protein